MAWGSVVLGAQLTTIRLGVAPSSLSLAGYSVSVSDSATINQLINSPFVKDLLELTSDNTLAAVGTTPDFPVIPKWRKVVRQIG